MTEVSKIRKCISTKYVGKSGLKQEEMFEGKTGWALVLCKKRTLTRITSKPRNNKLATLVKDHH